jgi:hypothetical protein
MIHFLVEDFKSLIITQISNLQNNPDEIVNTIKQYVKNVENDLNNSKNLPEIKNKEKINNLLIKNIGKDIVFTYNYIFAKCCRVIFNYRYLLEIKTNKWDKEKKRNKLEKKIEKCIKKNLLILRFKYKLNCLDI